MTYSESGYKQPILKIAGAFLMVSAVGIPLLQLLTVDQTGYFMFYIALAFAVGGAFLLLGIPWASSHWARSLRRRRAAEYPDDLVEIVVLWVSPELPLALRVMAVDEEAITIHDSDSQFTIAWTSVEAIDTVREGMFHETSIRITMKGTQASLRFAPMRRVFSLLRLHSSDTEELSVAIRAMLHRSKAKTLPRTSTD